MDKYQFSCHLSFAPELFANERGVRVIEKAVKQFLDTEVKLLFDRHYSDGRMTITVAGNNFDEGRLLKVYIGLPPNDELGEQTKRLTSRLLEDLPFVSPLLKDHLDVEIGPYRESVAAT